MKPANLSRLPELVSRYEEQILDDWLKSQEAAITFRKDLLSEETLIQQSRQFLSLFQQALQSGNTHDINAASWTNVKQFLEEISRTRTEKGFTFVETATFIFSLKQPLFSRIQKEFSSDTRNLGEETWLTTELLDKLGLFTANIFQKTREMIIKRQQEELLELSTPVIKLWDKILALPMIGTLDSNRTQVVMESLLQKIVENDCEVAIIDITGVPNVDTLVAQHLLKAVTAARLMGTECLISGIRPQIAQTIVHLGVSLEGVSTKSSLADAFRAALKMTSSKFDSIEAAGKLKNG